MKRICPECNKPLEDSSLYFCASCGNKLENSLIRSANSFKTKVTEFVSEDFSKKPSKRKVAKKAVGKAEGKAKGKTKKGKKSVAKKEKIKVVNKSLNRHLMIGFGSVLIIGLTAVGVIYLTRQDFIKKDNKETEQVQSQPQPKVVPNSADLNFPQSNINLANQNIIKYIPYETDFYIVGNDILDFHQRFFGPEVQDDLIPIITPFVEGRFVTMGTKEGSDWVLTSIIYLIDKDVVDKTFEEVEIKDWYVQKVDDVLVVTNKEEMIQNVTDSSKGLARNIAQNPKTRTDGTPVPKDGQIIFVDINSEIKVLEELIYIFQPDVASLELLKGIIDQNPTKFVIRNDRE